MKKIKIVVPAKDHIDIDPRDQDRMLEYIKEISYEISAHFKGSEPYIKDIEKIDSIPRILGYLMPFIPVSVEEKQHLLEIDSLKQRGIAFMDILIMQMAIAELVGFPSIPTKVSLNEYLEISKFYSTSKSSIFINGVLDKVVLQLKDEKKIKKTGRGLIGEND